MKHSHLQARDFSSQFHHIFEVIEPQFTCFDIHSGDITLSFRSLLNDFIKENKYQDRERVEFENLLEFQDFVDERCDYLFISLSLIEMLRRNVARVIAAYSGDALFIGDHHHIYQPSRFDREFANYIHEKISRECYEKMSRLYRFYSIDIGPTLSEWFRTTRPDIFRNLQRSNSVQPFMPQAYTHRILPLIKEDEDLSAEIMAGLLYHRRTFGEQDQGIPLGMWVPECCINERVAEMLTASGVDYVILRSDQSNFIMSPTKVYELKSRKPNGEKSGLAVFYYHPFSREFSFDKWTTDNPAQTLNHLLSHAERDRYYLLAHDGELVHHRFEHSGVDVTGFFRQLPLEASRRNNPFVVFLNPGRYLQFLHCRAWITGEDLRLPEAELPDFPTSWSCGGYGLRTFFEEKGETIESLKEKSLPELLRIHAEFLALRDLQRSDYEPMDEDSWKILVKMKLEELEEKWKGAAEDEASEAVIQDLRRGVNICYDNRRFMGMKVAGAGRWAFGSLDSGDSDYQTYLLGAVSLVEAQVHELLVARTEGILNDRARTKAFFLAHQMEHLESLSGSPQERLKTLNDYYRQTMTAAEATSFKSKEEFFQEFLLNPAEATAEKKEELFSLLRLWSLARASNTSCAYFFDDLNNHVAEDAVLRLAEVIYQLEDVYKERVPHEVYENLKNCKSRFRSSRGQGSEVTAYEIATKHLNILRIQHSITKFEGITLAQFTSYLRDNPYMLPHPEGTSREYYRALINEQLAGFTSQDGVELLLSKISREAARTAKDIHMVVEKRDLESGEIINRLQMEVKYDQLIAEKPYAPSPVDPNLYLSIKIEDRQISALSHFTINTILPLLSDYGIKRDDIRTTYINKERFIFDYADSQTRGRRKGPSKNADVLLIRKGIPIEQLMKFRNDLRYIKREKERISREIPGVEDINPIWLEKLPGHLEKLMQDRRIQLFIYGYEGNPGLLKKIEQARKEGGVSLRKIIDSALVELKNSHHSFNLNLVRTFVLHRLFMSVDFAIGKYEIEQKVRHGRKITMKEAVIEYCEKEKIPCEHEMVTFKLWKYRQDEIKKFHNLAGEEEKIKRFLHQNLILKPASREDTYTMLTHPIIYLHGAANEVHNEAFYPDNEVIPRIVESAVEEEISLCFFPGSVAFVDQYSYLKKIRRYLAEKFALNRVYGGLFANGEAREIEKIREKDEHIFILPSLTRKESLSHFPREKYHQISSHHLTLDFGAELGKLQDYLNTCSIIYIGGGHSAMLGLRLRELSFPRKEGTLAFRDYLKGFLLRGGLLMGLSAGTMVTGMRTVNYMVKKMQLSTDIEGLGLVNGIFQVHFEEYGLPEHLNEIKAKYHPAPVIGIDTHTGLIDFVTVKVTAQESPVKKYGNSEGITRVELLKEKLMVMGEKTISLRNDRISTFLDGEEISLNAPFFHFSREDSAHEG